MNEVLWSPVESSNSCEAWCPMVPSTPWSLAHAIKENNSSRNSGWPPLVPCQPRLPNGAHLEPWIEPCGGPVTAGGWTWNRHPHGCGQPVGTAGWMFWIWTCELALPWIWQLHHFLLELLYCLPGLPDDLAYSALWTDICSALWPRFGWGPHKRRKLHERNLHHLLGKNHSSTHVPWLSELSL